MAKPPPKNTSTGAAGNANNSSNQGQTGGSAGGTPYVHVSLPPGYGTGPSGGNWQTVGPQAPTTSTTFDWQTYLTNWGFPPDVIAQLTQIFTGSDVNSDVQRALAYIRGTDWYAQTFPGIQAGINNGLINDESGYRAYTNEVNQYYQRYYGRSATSQEISNALTAGQTATAIGAHFQGQATIAAEGPQLQYELGAFDTQGRATDAELSSYGDQTAGLSNLVGAQLDNRIQLARQKMSRIFSGSLATPSLSVLKGSSLQGSSLNPAANAPDVNA